MLKIIKFTSIIKMKAKPTNSHHLVTIVINIEIQNEEQYRQIKSFNSNLVVTLTISVLYLQFVY